MFQKLKSDLQLMEGFRTYVEEMGGYESANWGQVSKYLEIKYNFSVKRLYMLRDYYYNLFIDKPEFTSHQLSEILRMSIKNKFKSQEFLPFLERQLNVKIPLQMYPDLILKYLKKILLLFLRMLPRKKKTLKLYCERIKMKSVKLFFQAIDIQDENDHEISQIKKYARLLEQLYLCYCDNIENSRPQLFTQLRAIISRHEFEVMISYLQYVDKLRKIFLDQYTREEDMWKHPFLKRTILANKQSALYIKLISYVDWESKYKLYYQIQLNEQDDEPYKMEIQTKKQKKKDLNNEFIQQKRKTRMTFSRKDNGKDPKTIMFEEDEIDQLEAQEPVDTLIERRDQIQSLYQAVFKYEIQLQK